MGLRILAVVLFGSLADAQPPSGDRLLRAAMGHAEAFRQHARGLISEEVLVQRCLRIPEHAHFAIGAAANPLSAQMVVTEIASDYSFGSLLNDKSGGLIELREVVSKNGKITQTPAAARKALQMDISAGEERIRKKMLAAFSQLGLLDVATDYGLILLAFTRAGLANMRIQPAGIRYFGTEEAFVFDWVQTSGGLLEVSGKRAVRNPMNGQLWVRLSDGVPLRVTASVERDEPKHPIRDAATIEFVESTMGCVVPATVVHRHSVDGVFLTENLYSYGRFRLFQADTTIQYGEPTKK